MFKKLAISSLIIASSVYQVSADTDDFADSIIIQTSGSETTVEESLHYKRTTKTVNTGETTVVVPTEQDEIDPNNPYSDSKYFTKVFDKEAETLTFKTKIMTLVIAKDGVTVNGTFHQWKNNEKSMGIFNSAEDVSIETIDNGFKIVVNWERHVPPRYKDDELTITEDSVKTTEDVEWSVMDWSGDVSSDIQKLNSSDAVNSLVTLINPFLSKPFHGRLYQKENMTYREMLVDRIIEQGNKLYGSDAENEFKREAFLKHYKVGFTADELIRLGKSMYGSDAENEILYMGAQAYLYSYTIDDLNRVADASYGSDAENRVRALINQKNLLAKDEGIPVVRDIPGHSMEEIDRSRYISKLIQVANDTRSSSSQDRILYDGLRNNLEREFSVTDILRIARATRSSGAEDEILVFAAKVYKNRLTQDDLKRLARATRSSSAQDEITMIQAAALGATNRFYDRDLKPGYGDDYYDSDTKPGYGGGYSDTKPQYNDQKSPGKAKVKVQIDGAGDADVDIKINQN